MKDLFGTEITEAQLEAEARARKQTKPNGYAARPGTGPAGETCMTCRFAVGTGGASRTYYKCEIIRHRWTHGPGTDILLKSPACKFFQAHG